MPVTIKKSQLMYKNESTGEYVSVDAVADKTSQQQINGINTAASNAIASINTAMQDIDTQPLTTLPKKAYKKDLVTNEETLASAATHAYAVGDYFYVADNNNDISLYKATAAIAVGNTISPGTGIDNNCIPAALADDVTSLSNDLDNVKADLNVNLENVVGWSLGAVASTDGRPTSSETRIRTDYIRAGLISEIKPLNGSKYIVFLFSEPVYTSYISALDNVTWRTEDVDLSNLDPELYVRIVLAANDNSNITTQYSSNILVNGHTDPTFSLLGKPADSLFVGKVFENAVIYRGPLYDGADLSEIYQAGHYGVLTSRSYTNIPELTYNRTVANLYIIGSRTIHSQIYVDTKSAYFRHTAPDGINYTSWKQIANAEKTLQNTMIYDSEDDLNEISSTSICRFSTSSIPANAPVNIGGLVTTFVYSSASAFQIYVNLYGDFYYRYRGEGGLGSWINLKPDKRLKMFLDFNVVKGAWSNAGNTSPNVNAVRADRIFNVETGTVLYFYLSPGWTYTIRQGDQEDSFSVTHLTCTDSEVVLEHSYFTIQFNKFVNGESINLSVDDFDNDVVILYSGSATKKNITDIHDLPESPGQLNTVFRAYQMSKIEYIPKSTLPEHSGGSIQIEPSDAQANVKIKGIPYSSMRARLDYVPQAVSIHSFMTMIQNPNSYLYTKYYSGDSPDYLYNSRCYAGAVCSSLVAYCYGIDDVLPTTVSFDTYPGFIPLDPSKQKPEFLKLGYMLNKSNNHIVIITDIVRSSRGRIKSIEVTEGWKPRCRSVRYSPDQIKSRYFDEGYTAYKYENIDSIGYLQSPWVNVDDSENGSPLYNLYLSPRRGEQSNWMYGENVEIDVLDSQSFNEYCILDRTSNNVIRTGTIVNDLIVLSGLDEGKYSVYLTDGNVNSEPVDFDVINPVVSYEKISENTVRVTYNASSNKTPSAIYWCCNKIGDADHKAVRSFHILTQQERAQGYADVEEPSNMRSADTTNGVWFMRMSFKTEYGLFSSDLSPVDMTA